MHAYEERIRALGADVVFLAFDPPDALRAALLEGIDLAFPLVADPERTAYRAWGLDRAAWQRIWLDPNVWRQYGRLLLEGQKLRRSGSDPLQLGGDFIVDAAGTLAYSRPQERDDRPPVNALLRVLERSRGAGGSSR